MTTCMMSSNTSVFYCIPFPYDFKNSGTLTLWIATTVQDQMSPTGGERSILHSIIKIKSQHLKGQSGPPVNHKKVYVTFLPCPPSQLGSPVNHEKVYGTFCLLPAVGLVLQISLMSHNFRNNNNHNNNNNKNSNNNLCAVRRPWD